VLIPQKPSPRECQRKRCEHCGSGLRISIRTRKPTESLFYSKVFAEAKQLKDSGDGVLLPGVGPHPGFSAGEQIVITIPDDILRTVSEKIVRGCEYKLNSGAYVEEPLRVKIYFVHDRGAEDLTAFLEKLPVSSLWPGFGIIVEGGKPQLREDLQAQRRVGFVGRTFGWCRGRNWTERLPVRFEWLAAA
jgi:hypothetical protein